MAVPLLSKKIVKKRVKKFKRPQSDRKISVKVFIFMENETQYKILTVKHSKNDLWFER